MILFEDNFVKVGFDKTVPCVVWRPLAFASGDDFRKPFLIGMKFFEQKIKDLPSLGWINNIATTKIASKPEDLLWLVQNINPAFSSAGGKKVAFVLPDDLFTKIAMRLYIQYSKKVLNDKFEIKVFNTFKEAKLWLKGSQSSSIEEVKI